MTDGEKGTFGENRCARHGGKRGGRRRGASRERGPWRGALWEVDTASGRVGEWGGAGRVHVWGREEAPLGGTAGGKGPRRAELGGAARLSGSAAGCGEHLEWGHVLNDYAPLEDDTCRWKEGTTAGLGERA